MSGAIAGLAISTAVSGISFYQANQQKKLSQQAELDAAEAMEAARGKLDVNFAEEMSIKKEAYDNQREAMLVQGAMATNAGIESERGSAATAGRVYAGQQAGQTQIRNAMSDEQTNIEAAILEEESRLRDLDVSLDLEEVAGNQMKASDAQRAAAAANQQGLQSGAAALQSGLELVPLYMKDRNNKGEFVNSPDYFKTQATTNAPNPNPYNFNYQNNTANPQLGNQQFNFNYADPFGLNPVPLDVMGNLKF
jgi:hypothetical protein